MSVLEQAEQAARRLQEQREEKARRERWECKRLGCWRQLIEELSLSLESRGMTIIAMEEPRHVPFHEGTLNPTFETRREWAKASRTGSHIAIASISTQEVLVDRPRLSALARELGIVIPEVLREISPGVRSPLPPQPVPSSWDDIAYTHA